MKDPWAVIARYAAPGGRPGNRRHLSPEDFLRAAVVGPAAAETIEAVLDLLSVPEETREKIRAKEVVRRFAEGQLSPPQAHRAIGMFYVSDAPDAQLVEWSIEFAFVSQILEGGA